MAQPKLRPTAEQVLEILSEAKDPLTSGTVALNVAWKNGLSAQIGTMQDVQRLVDLGANGIPAILAECEQAGTALSFSGRDGVLMMGRSWYQRRDDSTYWATTENVARWKQEREERHAQNNLRGATEWAVKALRERHEQEFAELVAQWLEENR